MKKRNKFRVGKRRKSRRIYGCLRLSLVLLLLLLVGQGNVLFYRSRILLPFALHFSNSYLLLAPGDCYSLQINGMLLQTEYTSSRSIVASVTQNGVVRAWKPGQTIITATIRNRNGKKIRCMVQVAQLSHTRLTLGMGEHKRLYIRGLGLLPFGVRWKSRDKNVAVVSSFGRVRAVGPGSTVVSATVRGKTFECVVTVRAD
ncbi:MAG: Ig-like domain-containing protein [Lachnospiraceae bacterium]|nr:Ig-like domain-containing protein [Lachnospiraceae bacterium]